MQPKVMQVQGWGASLESLFSGEGEKNSWVFKSPGFVSEKQGREKTSCGLGKRKRKGKAYDLQELEAVCRTWGHEQGGEEGKTISPYLLLNPRLG